jgi:hypothetical protein
MNARCATASPAGFCVLSFLVFAVCSLFAACVGLAVPSSVSLSFLPYTRSDAHTHIHTQHTHTCARTYPATRLLLCPGWRSLVALPCPALPACSIAFARCAFCVTLVSWRRICVRGSGLWPACGQSWPRSAPRSTSASPRTSKRDRASRRNSQRHR